MKATQQENPTNKAKPDFYSKPSSPPQGRFKRFLILILGLVILGSAVVLSLWAWNFNELHPRTDDAVARANMIGIAPRVSGPIIKLNVSDNQSVRGGDLLFEIDPADYQLSVDRAKAALDALDQQIVTAQSQDAQLKFQVKAAEAGVRQATAERDQVADTLRRLEPLLPKGYATKEQVDEARTKVASAEAQGDGGREFFFLDNLGNDRPQTGALSAKPIPGKKTVVRMTYG